MPWVKWSYADWLRDPGLRLCSAATRGIWMDMLAHMDADDERGFLTVNGEAADKKQIARRLGMDCRVVKTAMKELTDNGVLSIDARGALFNRRMVRDAESSAKASAAGKKGGGNPALQQETAPQVDEKSETSRTSRPEVPKKLPLTLEPKPYENKGLDDFTYKPDLDKETDKKEQPPSGARAADAAPPPAVPGNVVSLNPVIDAFWAEGLPLVQRLFPGHTDSAHRRMLGKLAKESGDRHQAVVLGLRDALNRGVVNPAPWILQAVKVKGGVSLVDAGSADRHARFAAKYGGGPVGPEYQGQTIEGNVG